jgi:hypothetical protein
MNSFGNLLGGVQQHQQQQNKSPLVVEQINELEFANNGKTSFRFQISKFNGKSYVGIVKFYWHEVYEKWIPTKKSIFMPTEIWGSLLQAIPGISAAMLNLPPPSFGKQMLHRV